jgi:hypothetical protein
LGLKDQACLFRTCFLLGQHPKSHHRLYFQLLAVEKGIKMFSQLHFSPYFTPATFFLFLKVKSGHPQEELVGGRPHHHYIKARRRRPRVDRALKKMHILLMTMPKNYLKQVSL